MQQLSVVETSTAGRMLDEQCAAQHSMMEHGKLRVILSCGWIRRSCTGRNSGSRWRRRARCGGGRRRRPGPLAVHQKVRLRRIEDFHIPGQLAFQLSWQHWRLVVSGLLEVGGASRTASSQPSCRSNHYVPLCRLMALERVMPLTSRTRMAAVAPAEALQQPRVYALTNADTGAPLAPSCAWDAIPKGLNPPFSCAEQTNTSLSPIACGKFHTDEGLSANPKCPICSTKLKVQGHGHEHQTASCAGRRRAEGSGAGTAGWRQCSGRALPAAAALGPRLAGGARQGTQFCSKNGLFSVTSRAAPRRRRSGRAQDAAAAAAELRLARSTHQGALTRCSLIACVSEIK